MVGSLDNLEVQATIRPTQLTGSADEIEKHRRDFLGRVISILYDTFLSLREGSKGCGSSACSSMMLGNLTYHMYGVGLTFPPPESPLLGHSFEMISEAALEMKTPGWYDDGGNRHYCTIQEWIEPSLIEENQLLEGLVLEDFRLRKRSL